RLLPLARLDCALHRRLDRLAVFAREEHIVFRPLQEASLDVLEDECEPRLLLLHQVKCDQPAGDVGADAERAEVHRAEMILRLPVQRNLHQAAPLVHLDDLRRREPEQKDVLQRPEPDAQRFFVHRFSLLRSIFRFAYTTVMRSNSARRRNRSPRVSSDIGSGNSITSFPASSRLAMYFAARGACQRNGIFLFFSVIGVATNPGLMIVTPTPSGFNSMRLASRNDCIADFVAESTEDDG